MRLARRLARLERQVKAVVAAAAPTFVAYIPHNGRGELPPGGKSFRSGPGLVAIYDLACPPQRVSDAWPGQHAPRS
jgi:hypothetical protein